MIFQLLKRYQRLVQLLFWLTLLVVVALSLRPYPFETISFNQSDKVQHFLAYLALGGLMGAGGFIKGARPFLTGLVILVLLGGAIEIAQGTHWIGRTASWLDLLADAIGAAAGLAISLKTTPR